MSKESEQLKKLQEELQRNQELMFHTAKLAELGKLVAVVVHELSQPLLGIKAFAQILKRRCGKDSFIEPKLKLIEEQAIHMEGILNSLRQFYKSVGPSERCVDLTEPVRLAVELFKERAKKAKVRLQWQANGDLPKVLGNRGHLQQVLVNLLANALDALEGCSDGRISVVIDPVSSGARLRVLDSGKGISKADEERLFEPFYTTKGSERGTGLGLSICRDILKIYRGEIRLMESKEVEEAFDKSWKTGFELLFIKAEEKESNQ